MAQHTLIAPSGQDDAQGAQRLTETFNLEYQPIFTKVDVYLGALIKEAPEYAEAYIPWRKALQTLARGVYLSAKKIPLPNRESFIEAVHMFTFSGAIQFLEDICKNCGMQLDRQFKERFREHMDMLLFSIAILQRRQQLAYIPIR